MAARLIGTVVVCLAFEPLAGRAVVPPTNILEVAHARGERMKAEGYVYPKKGVTGKAVDCVGFVLLALEDAMGPLPTAAQRRIKISDVKEGILTNNNWAIVREGDARTKGVQQALVDLGVGRPVDAEQSLPGDLIQYWMRRTNGTWFGHAGVIEKVTMGSDGPRALIYGSHQTLPYEKEPPRSQGGIGIAPSPALKLRAADDRRLYVVRPAASAH
jgi:hypothetical protein